MDIYGKLAIALILIWIIGWGLIFPNTPISKWGIKQFGNYRDFFMMSELVLSIPLFILCIVWLFIQ